MQWWQCHIHNDTLKSALLILTDGLGFSKWTHIQIFTRIAGMHQLWFLYHSDLRISTWGNQKVIMRNKPSPMGYKGKFVNRAMSSLPLDISLTVQFNVIFIRVNFSLFKWYWLIDWFACILLTHLHIGLLLLFSLYSSLDYYFLYTRVLYLLPLYFYFVLAQDQFLL